MISIEEARELTKQAKINMKLKALAFTGDRIRKAAKEGSHLAHIEERDLAHGDPEVVQYIINVLKDKRYTVKKMNATRLDHYGSTIKTCVYEIGW